MYIGFDDSGYLDEDGVQIIVTVSHKARQNSNKYLATLDERYGFDLTSVVSTIVYEHLQHFDEDISHSVQNHNPLEEEWVLLRSHFGELSVDVISAISMSIMTWVLDESESKTLIDAIENKQPIADLEWIEFRFDIR